MIVFYTNKFIPEFAAGFAAGPLVFIRPNYKDDKGLLEHEKCHVKQWLRTLTLHGLFYRFNETYRYRSEVEAYLEQLKYATDREYSRKKFAGFIKDYYNLNVSYEQAYKDLA